LEVRGRVQDGALGSDLPASLPDLVYRFMGTNAVHMDYRPRPIHRLSDTFEEFKRPLDSGRTIFVNYSTVNYAPTSYIPQALAIAAGRSVGVGPLGLYYMGRFANALVCALITWFAISRFPFGRTFALLIALLPMTQFMTASFSPDAITIASAMLFTSILARFLTDGVWSTRRSLVAFAAGLWMCASKIVYLPMLFAGLGALFDSRRFPNLEIRLLAVRQVVAAVVTVSLVVLWLGLNTAGTAPTLEGMDGADMAGQVKFLAADVYRSVEIMVRSLYLNAVFLAGSTIGYLGWLNLRLPNWVLFVVAIAFPLSVYADLSLARRSFTIAAWLMLIVVAVVVSIELALYVSFTPVGRLRIQGIQGRYFIPALPLLGLAFAALFARRVPPNFAGITRAIVVVILGVAAVVMHASIIGGYGLF
jgi:uncharacterized membrane protein